MTGTAHSTTTAPQQAGPLGEGSIENGLLRCPRHRCDDDPLTATPPPFTDAPSCVATEVRDGGVYVDLPDPEPHQRTVGDQVAESLVA